ncbi:MAG: 16S rRNA (guanine(527)-N(7))-methyltransferase RsmG [Candidatus Cardinium sp.]|nr:16S rRNA (guanine(527)-N(7))-methyltransferase RsmG [Candidatus Cardinium sp.]
MDPQQQFARIIHYFPTLTADQIELLSRLDCCYRDWNSKINLISRKDIHQLYLHHVLHALAIAKVITFVPHTMVLDLGTGGGFPAIPLAIAFPAVQFHLVDAIGKKIKAVQAIVMELGLSNVTVTCTRGESLARAYDFVVGRAVSNLETFYKWSKSKIAKEQKNSLPNGMLYLTGQPTTLPACMQLYALQLFFQETFFKEKCLVYAAAPPDKTF